MGLIIIADERVKYKNVAVHLVHGVVLKIDVKIAVFNLPDKVQKIFKDELESNKAMKERIYVDENKDITIEYLEQKCRLLKETQDLDNVIIDLEKEQLQIDDYEEFSERLKDLSIELGIMIAVITKLNNKKDKSIESIKNHEITKYADEVWFNNKKGINKVREKRWKYNEHKR